MNRKQKDTKVGNLDEILQSATNINVVDILSFRAKVALAAEAAEAGPGALRALAQHLVGRYTVQTLKRLAVLEPLLERRQDLVTPDANLGVVWLAFKLCSDGDDDVNLARFEALLDEAASGEYSLADAKRAWGVEEEPRGGIDLGPAVVEVMDTVDGAMIAIVIEDLEIEVPAERLKRVKVWPDAGPSPRPRTPQVEEPPPGWTGRRHDRYS